MHSLLVKCCRIDSTEAFAVPEDLASSESCYDIESRKCDHVGGLGDRAQTSKLIKSALGSGRRLANLPTQRHHTCSMQDTVLSPNSGDCPSRTASQGDIVASCLLVTHTASQPPLRLWHGSGVHHRSASILQQALLFVYDVGALRRPRRPSVSVDGYRAWQSEAFSGNQYWR